MASRRSALEVAGLPITAAQLSISFAGGAADSATQATGGSSAVWAWAGKAKAATARTAVAAMVGMNDRMTGSWKYDGLRGRSARLRDCVAGAAPKVRTRYPPGKASVNVFEPG